jgi:hypothetical protein
MLYIALSSVHVKDSVEEDWGNKIVEGAVLKKRCCVKILTGIGKGLSLANGSWEEAQRSGFGKVYENN